MALRILGLAVSGSIIAYFMSFPIRDVSTGGQVSLGSILLLLAIGCLAAAPFLLASKPKERPTGLVSPWLLWVVVTGALFCTVAYVVERGVGSEGGLAAMALIFYFPPVAWGSWAALRHSTPGAVQDSSSEADGSPRFSWVWGGTTSIILGLVAALCVPIIRCLSASFCNPALLGSSIRLGPGGTLNYQWAFRAGIAIAVTVLAFILMKAEASRK